MVCMRSQNLVVRCQILIVGRFVHGGVTFVRYAMKATSWQLGAKNRKINYWHLKYIYYEYEPFIHA